MAHDLIDPDDVNDLPLEPHPDDGEMPGDTDVQAERQEPVDGSPDGRSAEDVGESSPERGGPA